jgi:hypothetical protein
VTGRTLGVFATMLGLALLSGCGGGEDASSDLLLTRSSADAGGAELDGLVSGTLELDLERGCVLVSEHAVVWPAETTLATDPPTLHLPGGLTATPGDVVEGGGGWVPLPGSPQTIEGDVDKALACAADGGAEVALFTVDGAGLKVTPGG